jgi:hypothetical protein
MVYAKIWNMKSEMQKEALRQRGAFYIVYHAHQGYSA